ncbi:hypothetical protein [Aeromicrobium sp.]|uniref:hypothetical protein n=1 Tax=Aeromicrobium sp. TaxID=1871063 RepID=UPI002FC9244E
MTPQSSKVQEALRRGRFAVQEHTDLAHAAGTTWREETVTEQLLLACQPEVSFADFHREQEAELGADWLWWWISPDGTSYGALVQAKKLTFTAIGTPKVVYRHGTQYADLLRTSEELEVPAIYAVYFGGLEYRRGWPCEVFPPGCDPCMSKTVTILPALIYSQSPGPVHAAELALELGTPLEELAGIGEFWRSPLPALDLDGELREFLDEPQLGAREIAQLVMSAVAKLRGAQFEQAISTTDRRSGSSITADRVFVDLPQDRLHSGDTYFEHVLRGLRRTPPGYVLDLENGNDPPDWLVQRVGGVGIIRL